MGKVRIATGSAGAGGFGLTWVLDRMWENPETWVLYAVAGVSSLLIAFAVFGPALSRLFSGANGDSPRQSTSGDHSSVVDISRSSAGGDLTININSGTIDPVEERDLGKEQQLSQQSVQTEAVDYEQWKHWPEIDLPTAAAIWSGSWDVGNAYRHVCFRNLKWAINNGHLAVAQRRGNKANIKSSVRPPELKEFFDQWDNIRNKLPFHDPRVGLSQFRETGVMLRNEAHTMSSSDFCNHVDSWLHDVYDEIENIDPADAGWFTTLDAVPSPRINSPQPLTGQAPKCYRELDFMLVKLESLIFKYGTR